MATGLDVFCFVMIISMVPSLDRETGLVVGNMLLFDVDDFVAIAPSSKQEIYEQRLLDVIKRDYTFSSNFRPDTLLQAIEKLIMHRNKGKDGLYFHMRCAHHTIIDTKPIGLVVKSLQHTTSTVSYRFSPVDFFIPGVRVGRAGIAIVAIVLVVVIGASASSKSKQIRFIMLLYSEHISIHLN